MRPLVPVAVLASLALAFVFRGGCQPAPGPAIPSPSPSPSQVALLPPPTPAALATPGGEPVAPTSPSPEVPASPTPEATPTAPPPPPPPPKTPEEIAVAFTICLQQGMIALRENRTADALPLLQRAHELMPRDQRALRELRRAEAAAAAAQLPAGERDAFEKKRAAERDDLVARARAALATDVDLAGHLFAELRNKFPGDPAVAAGRPALEAARAARAEKVVRERRMGEWRGHVARGEAAYKAGQLEAARAAYEEALKAIPGDPLARQWIAAIDARRSRPPATSPSPRPSPAASPAKKPARRKPR